MKATNETDALDELIVITEQLRAHELALLKEQFHITYQSLKPVNIIKNAFHDMTASPDVRNDLVSNAIGLGAGFLSKKVLVGSSHNPIKKILGNVTQFAVANLVAKYGGGIAAVGSNLLKSFSNTNKKKGEPENKVTGNMLPTQPHP